MPRSDRFFRFLSILLLAYALMGKGAAYFGVSPLYVGELVMLYGVYALAMTENWSRVLRTGWFWPLGGLMIWSACRTIPFIPVYGVDALHDGAFWMWGTYAIVIASLMAAEPRRIVYLEGKLRLFFKLLLIFAPISYLITFFDANLPNAPWADVPVVLVKGGDIIVHTMGAVAFAALVGGMNNSLVIPTALINIVLNFTGRASMVIFGMCMLTIGMLRPRSRVLWGVIASLVIGVVLMWGLRIDIGTEAGEGGRHISADQILQNVYSIFGDSKNENLAGSKEWRLKWWDKIITYTIHGRYFWTGKGFGVNLADEDGFQVAEDHSLRNPHNGHLTMLARGGVPGFSLWILCQLTLAYGLVDCAYSAYRRKDGHWFGFLTFLGIYWVSYLVNAAFDVFLEGPVGGIWFWSVYGLGIGSIWIYKNCPNVLNEVDPSIEIISIPKRKRGPLRESELSCAS